LTSPTESIPARSPLPHSTDSKWLHTVQPRFSNRPETIRGKPRAVFGHCRPSKRTVRRTLETVRQDPSHGIWSPSAHAESEIHSTRVCLARYVPLPGFLSLLGAYSSRNRSVLFHTDNAPGVSPSGLFPLDGYGTLSSLVALLALSAGFPTVRETDRNRRVGLQVDPHRIFSDLPSSRSPPGRCSPRESVLPTSEC
jgi:hypothetical protein